MDLLLFSLVYPLLLALLSAFLFGLSTPLSKGLLSDWTPQQLAGMLYLGASLGVVIPLALGKKRFFPARAGGKNVWRLAGAILFGGMLGPLLLMAGLELASAASVSLWLNLEMAATAILGTLLFRDHLGKWGWLGTLAILCAGLMLSWGEGVAGLKAGLLAGAACLCWGLDNHLTALIDGLLPMQSAFWKGLTAGTFNLILGLSIHAAPHASGRSAAGALLLGAMSYGISIVLYITAAQSLGASRSQMIFASAPLFGLLASGLWLKDTLTIFHGVALGFQSLGIFLLFKDRHAHVHSHEEMEHTHEHRHDDGHHLHTHAGRPASLRHSHRHTHAEMSHSHPHWPDLHHRHAH